MLQDLYGDFGSISAIYGFCIGADLGIALIDMGLAWVKWAGYFRAHLTIRYRLTGGKVS